MCSIMIASGVLLKTSYNFSDVQELPKGKADTIFSEHGPNLHSVNMDFTTNLQGNSEMEFSLGLCCLRHTPYKHLERSCEVTECLIKDYD